MHMLAISALANGKTDIDNILINDDFITFLNALEKLGIESDYTYSSKKQTRNIRITGRSGRILQYLGEIHIQNSTTSLYFLMSMLNLGKGVYCISAGAKLRERPIVDVKNILETMGVEIRLKDDEYPPLLLNAQGFRGGKINFSKRINHQEQVLAPLLVTAPYGLNPLEIHFDDENARINSHIDVTIDCMKKFGVEVKCDDDYKYIRVANNQEYQAPETIKIESDATISVHFFAVAAIVGGRVRIENINYNDTKQEYIIRFVDILEDIGCTVIKGQNFIEVSRDIKKELKPINTDMKNIRMLVQLVAVVALRCNGESILTNCLNIEDGIDRLKIICREFKHIGATVERVNENTIKIIAQKKYRPNTIDTFNDYRTVMAFSLIGTFIDGVYINNEHSITKTYTEYFDILDKLAN